MGWLSPVACILTHGKATVAWQHVLISHFEHHLAFLQFGDMGICFQFLLTMGQGSVLLSFCEYFEKIWPQIASKIVVSKAFVDI